MVETVATFLKGRISITDLLSDDRPFYQIHELYRLVFLRMKAQQEAEEKKKLEEIDKENKERAKKGLPPLPRSAGIINDNSNQTTGPSPLEAEVLQDAMEDMFEGGV